MSTSQLLHLCLAGNVQTSRFLNAKLLIQTMGPRFCRFGLIGQHPRSVDDLELCHNFRTLMPRLLGS